MAFINIATCKRYLAAKRADRGEEAKFSGEFFRRLDAKVRTILDSAEGLPSNRKRFRDVIPFDPGSTQAATKRVKRGKI